MRIHISGGVWSSQFQTCHLLGDRFLSRPPARRSGSGGALREERPQDHRRWSTRQQRWRLMRRGDALAGACSRRGAIHGSRAGGLRTHCLLHSQECERDRTNSPGLSLHVRPGGRQKSGAATAGVHALRAGRLLTFFVIPPAAPQTQKKRHKTRRLITHCTTSCADTREHRSTLAQPHVVIQKGHSARAARARTSVTWITTRTVVQPSRFKRPPPPRPSSLVRNCVR